MRRTRRQRAWRRARLTRCRMMVATMAVLLVLGGIAPHSVEGAQPGISMTPENAASVVQQSLYGKGTPGTVTLAPDGQTLAVNSSTGIRLYDAQTLAERWFSETPGRAGTAVFAPDSATVAAATEDGAVRLWRVADGTVVFTGMLPQPPQTSTVFAFTGVVAFSPDGSLLAAGGAEGKVMLWRAADGMPLRALAGGTSAVITLVFSPDGAYLFSVTLATKYVSSSTFSAWRVADGTRVSSADYGYGFEQIHALDGRTLITSASYPASAPLQLWQITDGVPAKTVTIAPNSPGFTVDVLSPDGMMLLTVGTGAGGTQLWRVTDGTLLQAFSASVPDFQLGIPPVFFTRDGSEAAISGAGTFSIWGVADGMLHQTLAVANGTRLLAAVFLPDRAMVAALTDDGYLRLLRRSDGTIVNIISGYARGATLTSSFTDIAVSSDGSLFATVSQEGFVAVRQMTDGAVVQVVNASGQRATRIGFSADSSEIIAVGSNGTMQVWRLSDGALVRTLTIPCAQRFCTDLSVAMRGDLIAIGPMEQASGGPVVQLWRISDGILLHTLPASSKTRAGSVLTFSSDGALLATILGDSGMVQVWQTADATLLQTLAATLPADGCHHGYNRSAAFTLDGRTLVTTADDLVWLWRVSDGALLRTFATSQCVTSTGGVPIPTTTTAPAATITLNALTPDGQMLALAMTDRMLQLWRVSDGTLVRTLGPLPEPITALTFSPDGSLLLAGFADSTVRVWG